MRIMWTQIILRVKVWDYKKPSRFWSIIPPNVIAAYDHELVPMDADCPHDIAYLMKNGISPEDMELSEMSEDLACSLTTPRGSKKVASLHIVDSEEDPQEHTGRQNNVIIHEGNHMDAEVQTPHDASSPLFVESRVHSQEDGGTFTVLNVVNTIEVRVPAPERPWEYQSMIEDDTVDCILEESEHAGDNSWYKVLFADGRESEVSALSISLSSYMTYCTTKDLLLRISIREPALLGTTL